MTQKTKRLSLIVLIFALVFAAVAMQTFAATALTGLTDTSIGLTYDNGTWEVLGEASVKGSVQSTSSGSGCSATINPVTGTLTITNNKGAAGEEAILYFDYTLTGDGTVVVAGQTVTEGGSYSTTLAYGESVTVQLTSSSEGTLATTITLSNIQLYVNAEVSTTFDAVADGSYTVESTTNGTVTVTDAAVTLKQSASETYNLTATAGSGYKFFGWRNGAGAYVSYANPYVLTSASDQTVYPEFIAADAALFDVGGTRYYDLNAADAAASSGSIKTIVLLESGTLAAGDYTISAANTLLIPFDSANTLYTVKGNGGRVAADAYATPTVYRKLTLASGTNITVNGAISVSANHCAGGSANGKTSYCGSPSGPCGFMDMASGSAVTINNGGALYAWGFVTGSGEITAKEGATVYENMQVADFRGGTATTAMTGGGMGVTAVDCGGTFPFSQYYVQNIEARLTLEKGANEYATISLTISSIAASSTVHFIGDGALFTISSGSVCKWYDGSKDRLNLEVNGTVEMNPMNLSISAGITSISINSADYTLPLNNNLTITVKNGSNVNLNQDMALLPGAEVNVESGATLTVPSGYSMYVYDGDQWDRYQTYNSSTDTFADATGGTFVNQGRKWTAVGYAPGRAYTRTQADITADAKVDLNGTLIVSGGAYTTAGGANIFSSGGTGKVEMKAAPDAAITHTYQALQNGSTMSLAYIPITSLKLNNGSDYTETADAVAGDIYYPNSDCAKWVKNVRSGHSYEVVVTPPTCGVTGYTTYTCTGCGYSYVTDETEALAHDYSQVAETAPTCTEQGYTTHTCVNCGDSYVDTYVDALGHSYDAGAVTAPTCTEQGYTTYTCGVCGHSYADAYVDALGHSYNAGVVTAPTCDADGYTTYTCGVCGHTYTDNVVAALGHNYSEAVTAPTCTTEGYTTYTCATCGDTYTGSTVAALGHSWDEGVATSESTCTDEGAMLYTCTVCGETRTEAVSAKGHTEVIDAAVEATCTTAGLTEGSHCSVCDAILTVQEEIPALGHSYDAVVTEPTCEAQGYTTHTCANCGDSYVDTYVDALGHSYEAVVTDPTCTEEGYTTYTCANCGDSYESDPVAALGHSYESVVTDPTCTEQGCTTYTCSACGDSYVADYTDALGHSYDAVVTEPTCTEQGYTTYTCTVCGDSYEADYTDAVDHTYGEWFVETAATCTAPGVERHECENCDAYETREIPVIAHSYNSVTTPATCVEKGYTTHTCSACGDAYIDSYMEPTGHSYGEWVDVSAPTCTTDGEKQQTCGNCGHVITEVITALGHTEVIDAAVEPTCTETGLTEGSHCSVCDEVLNAQEVVAALGHTEVIDAAVKPTCTETGLTEGKHCSVCNEVLVEQVVLDAAGHNAVINAAVKPTCGASGLTEGKYCDVCDEILVAQEEIPATGEHSYEAGSCTVCGAEDPSYVKIVTQPVDFVGLVGETATFTVVANRENVTYQWYFSSDNGATWQKYTGATAATMSVEFKAYRLNYQYRCEITDTDTGVTISSNAATMLAKDIPLEIITQPVSYVGSVNDEIVFSVEATGNGLVYEWFYSEDNGETWYKSYTPGYMEATLTPILRAYRDGNQYKCVITDVFGNSVETDPVSMTVKSSDVIITVQPVAVENAVLGQLYYYSVEAEGENLEYRWEYSTDGGATWQESWNDGYNTATLSVRMQANRDGNLYRCKVTSGLKTVLLSDAAILDLQDPSVAIIMQPSNSYVLAGSPAGIHVEATGMDLTYAWYRSNDDGNTWTQTWLEGYNTDTLTFAANTTRAALYMCKITDGSGTAVWSSIASLKILSGALEITGQPENMTCAAGETATFTVAAQGDTLKYAWYASSDNGETWTPTYLGGYNTESLSFVVNTARAAKLYKCVVTDIAGNTVESDAVSVTIN